MCLPSIANWGSWSNHTRLRGGGWHAAVREWLLRDRWDRKSNRRMRNPSLHNPLRPGKRPAFSGEIENRGGTFGLYPAPTVGVPRSPHLPRF